MSTPDFHENSQVYADALAVASRAAERLRSAGHISESYYHQLLAQLNGTIYTLMFALPIGSMPLERTSAGGETILVKTQVASIDG